LNKPINFWRLFDYVSVLKSRYDDEDSQTCTKEIFKRLRKIEKREDEDEEEKTEEWMMKIWIRQERWEERIDGGKNYGKNCAYVRV